MASPKNKPISEVPTPLVDVEIAPDIDLESAIADELLDSLDWGKVRSAIIRKAPAKLFAWLTSGSDRPVNISQFPELSALPSADKQEKAA